MLRPTLGYGDVVDATWWVGAGQPRGSMRAVGLVVGVTRPDTKLSVRALHDVTTGDCLKARIT